MKFYWYVIDDAGTSVTDRLWSQDIREFSDPQFFGDPQTFLDAETLWTFFGRHFWLAFNFVLVRI